MRSLVHRPALLFGAAALAACAPAARPTSVLNDPTAGTVVTTRVDNPESAMQLRITADRAYGVEAPVRAGAARAYGVLAAAYDTLGLTVNAMVTDARLLGVQNLRAPRRIAGMPLSHYFDCGSEAAGLPRADSYAVVLTAVSRVTPTGDSSSVVATQVAAAARPLSTSGAEIRCASNGRLEQAINAAIVTRATR